MSFRNKTTIQSDGSWENLLNHLAGASADFCLSKKIDRETLLGRTKELRRRWHEVIFLTNLWSARKAEGLCMKSIAERLGYARPVIYAKLKVIGIPVQEFREASSLDDLAGRLK